jgi:hypothetical protein
MVPVLINHKISLNFTIDSGSTDVFIPEDDFSNLILTGTVSPNDYLDTREYELADGSQTSSKRFRIRSLRVGKVELRDIIVAVAPEPATPLLGQSFLSRMKSWSIDNERQLLVIKEPPPTTPQRIIVERENPVSFQPLAPKPDEVVAGAIWVLLGRAYFAGQAGPYEYVNASSIRISGSIRRAWFKSVPPRHIKEPTLSREAFNCDEETYREEALHSVKADGSSESEPAALYPGPWQSVVPDTEMGFEMHWVCAWKPK